MSARANDHQRAMCLVTAQRMVFSGINRLGRQLGDANGPITLAQAEGADNAVDPGSGSIECRNARDLPAGEFKIAGYWVKTIQSKRLGHDLDAKRGRFPRKPVSARLVTACRSTMFTLRIPCSQPGSCP